MAFTQGNKLASKSRIFEQTVKRALAADDYQKLRRIVDNVVALAEEGERWAVEMLRDTLDGRPAQQLVAQDEQGRELSIGLIAYATAPARPDDTAQVYTQDVSTPGITGPRIEH
jgi:hypothetical protein